MEIKGKYNIGSFGKKIIYYRFKKLKDSNNYFFFLHGVYSTCLKQKYFRLADRIITNNLGSAFLFESSRKVYSFESKLTFQQYLKTFQGKTFNDELQDVLNIFGYFFKNIIKNKKYARIILIGFSLGGTLGSFLLAKYADYIKGIILFGSGITTKGINRPITGSYPNKNILLTNFKTFKGGITLVQGSRDNVVPVLQARKIISESHGAWLRNLIILKGVDHTFSKVNGRDAEDKLRDTVFNIIKNNIHYS